MIRLIRGEFLKLRTTQVGFWLLVSTIAIGALLAVAQVAPRDGIRTQEDVPNLFAGFASSPAYVILFTLGALGVTTEFRYQTITPTVLQTPSRWAIVTAKMITYAIVGVVFSVAALAAETAVGVPWLSSKGIDVHWGDSNVQHAIIGTFGVLALFGIVGLGIGALVRNQIVTVVVGIIFLVVISNILLAIPIVKHVWPFTPNGGTQAILYTHGDRSVNGVELLSTWAGVAVLLAWAFIPAILGAAYSMNRDIT